MPEFHATANAKARELGGLDADVVEARMVGRFRSGSPISLNNIGDPALGGDELRNNDFDFGGNDLDGLKFPYAAHIRKAYPRDDLMPTAMGNAPEGKEKSSEANTQTHRVMRRSIPFGPEADPRRSRSRTPGRRPTIPAA